MTKSFLRRKKVAAATAIALVLAVGGAYAFFSSNVRLPIGSIQTAELSVTATEIGESVATAWLPGEERVHTWSITNDGAVPVYAKSTIFGEWETVGLSSSVVRFTKLEQKQGEEWLTIFSDSAGIPDEFFLSPTGVDVSLTPLAAGQSVEYRITSLLAAEVENEYQLENFDLEVQVVARQVTEGATWPTQL